MNKVITFHFTDWGSKYSRLIRWWRRNEEFTHVHMQVSTFYHYEVAAGSKAHWFPARNFNTKDMIKHRPISIIVPEEVWDDAVIFMSKNEGVGYDWIGVIGIALGFRSFLRAPKKWYCSSFCASLYNASIGKAKPTLRVPVKVTPTELLGYIERRHSLPKK